MTNLLGPLLESGSGQLTENGANIQEKCESAKRTKFGYVQVEYCLDKVNIFSLLPNQTVHITVS